MKTSLVRVYAPLSDDHNVHFQSVGIQQGVTLCDAAYFTDDNQHEVEAIETQKTVTCYACIGIVAKIQASRREKFK